MKVMVLCTQAAVSESACAPALIDTSDARALAKATEASACFCFVPSASLCGQSVLTEHEASDV